MISPWQCPLPLLEYANSQVVVYFYSGRWVPIMFSSLVEAIALSYRATLQGKKIFVFPPDINPCDCQSFIDSTKWQQPAQTNVVSINSKKKLEIAVDLQYVE